MIILTVGNSYIDIDGYASCIAYRELLKKQGIEAKFISSAPLNYSITNTLLNFSYHLDKHKIEVEDKFIILDLSNKNFFPDFVAETNIIELIDHHPGYENYWNEKLKENAIIEKIGSVATIIVEKYEKYNLLETIDKNIAKLLMAAILDNTLNFTAKITSKRDIIAYQKLEKITGDFNFSETYFKECQNTIESKLEESIVNDLKIQKTNEFLPDILGQLTIWDVNELLKKKNMIRQTMNKYGNKWVINIISLKDNISYIMYSDNDIKNKLNKLFDCNYNDEILLIKPAKLRKEIIGMALSKK